jgi:hypothetical protein
MDEGEGEGLPPATEQQLRASYITIRCLMQIEAANPTLQSL